MILKFAGANPERDMKDFDSTLNPELRAVVWELAEWSSSHRLPPVTVTSVVRYLDEHVALYVNRWKRLVARYRLAEKLSPADEAFAKKILKLSEPELAAMARNRWSWHRCACAVDLRVREYAPDQFSLVIDWLKTNAPTPKFVWLHELAPPHLHWEIRSELFRATFIQKRGPPTA